MHMTLGMEELQSILVFDPDRRSRAFAHLQLGRLAMREHRREAAVQHFREALVLDAHMDRAREFLKDLSKERPASGFGQRMRSFFQR
ncbi:MAG: hypothetical protein ACI9VR_003746 [Cognaticolwellia sp.]|jgi:hypothetical protein